MAMQFEPTMSKEIFVGRVKEKAEFEQVLRGERPEWIIHIPGKGGGGKTRLMLQMQTLAKQAGAIITEDFVDFYKPSNHTFFGLLQDIVAKLGEPHQVHFKVFKEELIRFRELLQTEPDLTQRQEAVDFVINAFFEGYQHLLGQNKKIVLFLDTCEEMHGVEPWVIDTFIPKIFELEQACYSDRKDLNGDMAGQVIQEEVETIPTEHFLTTLVIAGRKHLELLKDYASEQVMYLHLPSLSYDEARNFFEEGGCSVDELGDDNFKKLYDLSGGRPLYIALSYDWLQNEVGTIEELISLDKPFSENLVNWILRLSSVENRAILFTALAWRRMEPSLLAKILEGQNKEQAEEIIKKLSRFSFTKYRAPVEADDFVGSFQLHDEFRVLVLKYAWLAQGELTREQILRQIVEWYETERIREPEMLKGEQLPNDDEGRSLIVEWLFYQCQVDFDLGFEKYDAIFRLAIHRLDLALAELLHQQIDFYFKDELSIEQQYENRFKEAILDMRRERYADASNIWRSLQRRPQLGDKLKATCLQQLVELNGYTGRSDEAIILAEEAEALYKKMIAEELDPEKQKPLKAELGQLYNNRGFNHRIRSELDQAIEYYQKTLAQPGRRKGIARTMNNLGYIYFLIGNEAAAHAHVGRALEMRRQLGIEYELGLGYNTLGEIMEKSGHLDEAVDLYRRAFTHMTEARSRRGQALVLLNRGRVKRVVNEYEIALIHLGEAQQVFQEIEDTDNLIKVYNELACVYRQRRRPDDWQKAEEQFERSITLSEESKKHLALADNYEDLSILYQRWMVDHLNHNRGEEAEEYAAKTRETINKALDLARSIGNTYLVAKATRTLGDLAFVKHDFNAAFDSYFEACRLMESAIGKTEASSPVVMRRRYREMVNRLQEQLHKLSPTEEGEQAQRLLGKIEKGELEVLEAYLKASIDMAPQELIII